MTDMKYGKRPEGAADSFWDMLFDQFVALDLIINTLAVIGLVYCIVRRNVYGIAIGITALVSVALVYLTRDSLPVIGLLWNPRVLPLLYLTRFLMMMFGIVEVRRVRRQPGPQPPRPRRDADVGSARSSLGAGALAVLIIFGWSFQVLPFGGHRIVHGQPQYAWGPFRGSHGAEGNGDARSDGWSAYNFKGYEGLDSTPSTTTSSRRWTASARSRAAGGRSGRTTAATRTATAATAPRWR